MPSIVTEDAVVSGVAAVDSLLEELLQHAETVKQTTSIEPALAKSDFENLPKRFAQAVAPPDTADDTAEDEDPVKARKAQQARQARQNAIIETVARDKFSNLIATTSINSPDFVRVWNLLDILSILSDSGGCEPALMFWLVEELLDSQTIAGCRKVFDYLESRRERIVAKHFGQKNLVILRSCNELLRRLSRAEDTTFCGRVFIFMFQSFPLHDRSSVNLRGEYHVENETTFDEDVGKAETAEKMDVDTPDNGTDTKPSSKTVSSDGKAAAQPAKPLSPDQLYPIFWGLQSFFSQPLKLFEADNLVKFKAGIEATMATFNTIKPEPRKQEKEKQAEDLKRNPGEKSGDGDDALANTFNAKYLTSRDLFELELSDMSFRRNVLVQALILLDFLLSLSQKAHEKSNSIPIVGVPNKSVMYSDLVLSDDDTKWVNDMKRTIGDYIRQSHPMEGPYFLRMVESILVREKNWARWKLGSCVPIQKPGVSPQEFNEAKAVARKMATSKRSYSAMSGLSLEFLTEGDDGDAMKRFKSAERCERPDLMSYRRKIALDDFEIEMPTNKETKMAAIEGKASKSWRALRLASQFKLASFDKIDNQDKIDAVFEEVPAEEPEEAEQTPVEAADPPEDRRPVILVGPSGIGKSSLIQMLLDKNGGVFEKVPAHVTRAAEPGEKNGKDYHFVDVQAFNMMRDGDQFLQYTDTQGVNYATNRRLVDGVSEAGKVPVLVMDHEGAQQVKDMEYAARYVFVKPSSAEALEIRLKEQNLPSDRVEGILKGLPDQLQHAVSGDFYDNVILGDSLEEAYESLRAFIYGALTNGTATNGTATNGEKATETTEGDKDEPMADVSGDADTAHSGVDSNGLNGVKA